jgi:predicted NBD/HSP70 family sugar kinase
MDHWRDYDLCAQVQARLPYPVFLRNDASAACGAELVFGAQTLPKDFVYFYVGFFIGGGVVLNGGLHTGASGNSGALGSMPVRAPDGQIVQLIELASIYGLEKRLALAGLDPDLPWQSPETWPIPEAILTEWLDTAADAIAQAIVACLAVIDFKTVVIDGWFPANIRERLTEKVVRATAQKEMAGLIAPRFRLAAWALARAPWGPRPCR